MCQITIGNQGCLARVTETVDDYSTLAVGMFVAVHCPQSVELPQLGKVTARDETTFTIHWFEGEWNTAWKPRYIRRGRRKVPREDKRDLAAAILWDFHLTARNMLRFHTKTILKDKYRRLQL